MDVSTKMYDYLLLVWLFVILAKLSWLQEASSWQVAEPAINAIPITCFERARAKASNMTHPEKPGPAYLYGKQFVASQCLCQGHNTILV